MLMEPTDLLVNGIIVSAAASAAVVMLSPTPTELFAAAGRALGTDNPWLICASLISGAIIAWVIVSIVAQSIRAWLHVMTTPRLRKAQAGARKYKKAKS